MFLKANIMQVGKKKSKLVKTEEEKYFGRVFTN